jgi:hypothetical protein
MKIPVKKGDILNLEVIGVGNNGDLIMKKDNFSLFLKTKHNIDKRKYIQNNERYFLKVKVVKLFEKLGYVELIE